MSDKLLSILDAHGVMSIATNRPDGWPQATIVSYVNLGVFLYFLVARTSQKFANLTVDPRVSITVGSEAEKPEQIEGVSMSAKAYEVRPPYHQRFLDKLAERHPNYFDPKSLDMSASALMCAYPQIISVVDFSKGFSHAEKFSLGTDEVSHLISAQPVEWGPNPR